MDGAAAVASCLRAHKESSRVALWGVRAVFKLLNPVKSPKEVRKLVEVGLCQAVVGAMKEHPTNHGVQSYGAQAIFSLCWRCDAICAACGAAGACEVVAAALHGAASDFRDWTTTDRLNSALDAAGALAGLPRNSEKLAAAGACGAVVAMLRVNPSRNVPIPLRFILEQTQWCVLDAILALAKHSGARLGAAGACEALVQAVDSSCEGQALQSKALKTMLPLAQHPDNRARLRKADACAIVKRSLDRNGTGNEDLRIAAAAILSAL
eukprot:TRINITY_DN2466_c1_g1_i1.p1 TRINITY_DN2466_c1_g1~~TRINITY_DN2466_c1_g1_i1.p1  ORF type:complete len:276 (-),score=13.44 TRINITY_DN2466_c1_g1_i1:27-824(-)